MAKNLILWLVIAVVLMTVFNNFSQSGANGQQVAYSQFINQVHNGGVRSVDIDGRMITAQSRSGEQFTTVVPTQYDPKLLDDLLENNVEVNGKLPEEPSILAQIFISWFPMLLLIGVWIFFMRQMQGGGGKGHGRHQGGVSIPKQRSQPVCDGSRGNRCGARISFGAEIPGICSDQHSADKQQAGRRHPRGVGQRRAGL